MRFSHHDAEASTAKSDKIADLKGHYRAGIIGYDTFLLSMTLLGVNSQDARAEAAMIRMAQR